MTKMATIKVITEQYNDDALGVSVWVYLICGGGEDRCCGPRLCLRGGMSSCTGVRVVDPAEGGEGER